MCIQIETARKTAQGSSLAQIGPAILKRDLWYNFHEISFCRELSTKWLHQFSQVDFTCLLHGLTSYTSIWDTSTEGSGDRT